MTDRESVIAELQKEKWENAGLIKKLQEGSKQLDKQMFKKDEKIKVLQDHVNQLQDKNLYSF